MAKTKDELNQLKNEYETLNNKLKELTDQELARVSGGSVKKAPIEDIIETSVR